MTSFMPEEIKSASDKIASNWLKGSDFEGAGLVLQVAAPMENVASQYGAEEGDYLVENNILEVGHSFRYTFKDAEGRERKIDSSSTPFFIGFKQCEELGVGDWVVIKRTGKTDKTRYTVEKVEAPVAPESLVTKSDNMQMVAEAADDMAHPEDIPF